MKKVLLITGPAGDAQGWGDLSVTQHICQAIIDTGNDAEIAFVNTMEEFYQAIEEKSYDIVWSALYHISSKSETIGMSEGEDNWLADILDTKKIPYIGPNAATMKALIHKTHTHQILKEAGVSVPYHFQIDRGDDLPDLDYPAFVKPSYESRSKGISDESVVNSREELEKQVAYIHTEFDQPALVEEYLPGQEYTVLMLGNGEHQEFLAGRVEVDEKMFGKYPILRADLRGVGVTKIRPINHMTKSAVQLTKDAMEALNCLDHVRADMRLDANGKLKIIEVNGIPGLKPIKSWSPQMFTMHHPSQEGPMEDYKHLIDHVVSSALVRCDLA
ncbi:ATP-grasp domain-containing protein [Desulfobacula sp.]|uniref:ATP-grasp domain-containing protein n=1 Tax=Desulfobacula sp. TaxID=2593537 RepID=UPI002602093B|nr:ATP-grasp domain-containing protein [Desulfobacula sp.]